jgi:hypothetical protein
MGSYIVVNSHAPEDCEPMEAPMSRLPAHLKDKDFICTCPEGPHAFYLLLEGETAEQVIEGLPQEWRKGSTAYPAEIIPL